MPRPFRFGVNTTAIHSRSAWQDRARRLEAEGWSTVLVPDHLGGASTFAPLISAADVTTDLRVGNLVVNNDFFHPLRLAQEAATVDLLTDGRLELGLGSGWNEPEYRLLGLAYDRPSVRAARLRQAVATMKDAWAGHPRLPGSGDEEGPTAVAAPRQSPHPPLLIGGHGDMILSLAATEADIIGLTGLTWTGSSLAPTGATPEALMERVRFVREKAGPRFDELEFNILTQVTSIGGDPESTISSLASTLGVKPDVIRGSPLTLIGSVSEVADKLVANRERLGISYVVVFDAAIDDMTPVVAQLAGR
ncbi:MAG TPA: TIGR03621 family F420-dependent LLM class oxidoreductase [Acidimicrobiales bacterium]